MEDQFETFKIRTRDVVDTYVSRNGCGLLVW